FAHGLVGTRLAPVRRHDRWLGALSFAPQGGVREGAASNLPVPYRRRGGESGGGAVASARKGLAATQPKLRRGRPSTPAAKQAAHTKKRLEAQRAALFTHRYLFVQRHLNTTERKTLWRVSRGLPQLRALRAVMDQVYALFDRRCRTQTALAKLATLRRRLLRFPQVGATLKKLFSPTLEKALTFLDDKLLPATSNAVERGNRRYRKMQKSVYRVRTQAQIRARLALDMWREAHAEGRQHTLAALHRARAG